MQLDFAILMPRFMASMNKRSLRKLSETLMEAVRLHNKKIAGSRNSAGARRVWWIQTSPNYCFESAQEQMPWPLPSSTKTLQSSAKSFASAVLRNESISSSSVRPNPVPVPFWG